MQRLYLLRHGIAVPPGTPDIADDDRPLTSKGERRVREVAKGMRGLGVKVDRILTSPLPRAFRTAEIVARVLHQPDLLETAEELGAGRNAASIAAWLKTRSEEKVLLVGHNPSLTDLISLLVTGSAATDLCQLRRAGMAALVPREGDDHRMLIDWIARPKLTRII
jgi:phosphohistidine phosphatase